ncbi:hypothetical protein [Caballeronia arvi]|uniref:hypothetical protein n=1 Tax=Caballeronia arvi TaxID=1777135 RepID=UPI00117C7316|nr:hypothetical protein [Caballeronia arvi]
MPVDVDPVEWLRMSIDADRWLTRHKLVSPREASLALFGCNPDDARAADPLGRVDAPLKSDCKRLFEHLEQVKNADLRVHRTLTDWWNIARTEDLNYHPLFDDVMQTFLISEQKGNTAVPRREKPIRMSQQQENKILHAITELGYKPRSLPQNRPGIPGVKAEVRSYLARCLTSSGFRKAWDRLRDRKQIVYEVEQNP